MGIVDADSFSILPWRPRKLRDKLVVSVLFICGYFAAHRNIMPAGQNGHLRNHQRVVGAILRLFAQRCAVGIRCFYGPKSRGRQPYISPMNIMRRVLRNVVFQIREVGLSEVCNRVRLRKARIVRSFQFETEREPFTAVILIAARIHPLGGRK